MAENDKTKDEEAKQSKRESKETKKESKRETKKESKREETAEQPQLRAAAVDEDETPLVEEAKATPEESDPVRAQALRGSAAVARPTDGKGKEHYVGYRPIMPRSDEPNPNGADTQMLDGVPIRVSRANPLNAPNENMPASRLGDPGSQTMAEKEAEYPHLGLKRYRGVGGGALAVATPDTTGPTITGDAAAATDTAVTFTSNEPLDPDSVANADVSETSAAAITGVTLSDANTITVTFDGGLTAGDTVTLTANSVTDTSGNTGPANNVVITVS